MDPVPRLGASNVVVGRSTWSSRYLGCAQPLVEFGSAGGRSDGRIWRWARRHRGWSQCSPRWRIRRSGTRRNHRIGSTSEKLDGLRCASPSEMAPRSGCGRRNRNSFNERFPPDRRASLRRLSADNFAVDGEIVAFDGNDFRGFADLQRHGRSMAAVLCTFDLPQLQGRDITRLALTERKRLLHDVIDPNDELFLVEPLAGGGVSLLPEACAKGWEGLVAKRAASEYVSGRSLDWRKLKCTASQELVIGGWTEPRAGLPDGARRAAPRVLRPCWAPLRRQGRHRLRYRHPPSSRR